MQSWFLFNKICMLFTVTNSKFDIRNSLRLSFCCQIWAKRQSSHQQGYLIYIYNLLVPTNYSMAHKKQRDCKKACCAEHLIWEENDGELVMHESFAVAWMGMHKGTHFTHKVKHDINWISPKRTPSMFGHTLTTSLLFSWFLLTSHSCVLCLCSLCSNVKSNRAT